MNKVSCILQQIATQKILVIGDLMLDRYIFGDASRISPEAPVPVVDVDHESDTLGAAANVALNLRSLGVDVDLLGVVGDDRYGEKMKYLLREKEIHLIPCDRHVRTILKTRVIVRNQQLCRLDIEDDPQLYSVTPLVLEKINWESYNAVILSDYAKGVISQALVDRIVECTNALKTIVSVDPKPRNNIIYRGVDLLKPNYSEALEFAGIKAKKIDYDMLCHMVMEKQQPKNLVITLGKNGMVINGEDGQITQIKSTAREVFDVSGAGDTSIAVLTAAYANGVSLEDAAKLANCAAGIVVGKMGTATATAEEILRENRFE